MSLKQSKLSDQANAPMTQQILNINNKFFNAKVMDEQLMYDIHLVSFAVSV